MVLIDQVAQGIYRMASFSLTSDMSFNQFLIEDQHPTLIHTGTYPLYETVRQAVAQVLDPAHLEYIIVAHFEADECGGMGRFVAEARQAVLVCSLVGATINLTQWDYAGPVQGVQDGEVLDLGSHRLRFLETPHVHQGDKYIMWRNWSRIFMFTLGMSLLLTLFAACGIGTTTAPTSIPTHTRPTPALPPKGTVLFEADWSRGLTGWQATAGWKVINGILQSDESDTSTLTVPYRPAVTNYAIEFRARIAKVPSNNAAFGSFLISAVPQPGRDGYNAVVIQIPGAGPHPLSVHPQVEVYTEPIDLSNPGTAHDQEFGSQWHSFRVETQGDLVTFSIDGQLSGRSASQQTSVLSNGPIKLEVSGIILQVSDFRIIVA